MEIMEEVQIKEEPIWEEDHMRESECDPLDYVDTIYHIKNEREDDDDEETLSNVSESTVSPDAHDKKDSEGNCSFTNTDFVVEQKHCVELTANARLPFQVNSTFVGERPHQEIKINAPHRLEKSPQKKRKRIWWKKRISESPLYLNEVFTRGIPQMDAFAIFGHNVGQCLRNLNNEQLQIWARNQILNVIYKAEISERQAEVLSSSGQMSVNVPWAKNFQMLRPDCPS